MKKILLSGSLALLLLPALALASNFNDVTLDSNAVFSVGGIEMDVTASGATLNSITVTNSSTLSVVLGPGSNIALSAPGRNKISSDADVSFIVNQTCNDSASTLSLQLSGSAATTTVTVTPSSDLCAAPVGTGGSSSSGSGGSNGPIASGGGGGGGGGYYVAPAQPGTSPIVQTSAPGQAPGTGVAALQVQLQALLAQIAALTGRSAGGFTRDLQVGATGNDVRALQQWLNAHGYTITANGGGSPGNETTRFGGLTRAALARFQKAVGLSPAAGYFGPKTRAYIAAHP